MALMARAKGHHRKRLGRVVLFLVAVLLLGLALLFYTVLTADPRDVKLGVLSLDEGVQTAQGDSNLGTQMVEKLVSGDVFTAVPGSDDTRINSYSIEFKTYKTQDELNRALEDDEVTGAIVIPEDYTKNKIHETTRDLTDSVGNVTDTVIGTVGDAAGSVVGDVVGSITGGTGQGGGTGSGAAAGTGTTATSTSGNALVDVIVQNSTNPVVQQLTGSSITHLLDTAGLETQSLYPGQGVEGPDADQPVGSLGHLWLLLPPILASIVVAAVYPIRKGGTFAERMKRFVAMLVTSAILSALATAVDYAVLVNGFHYSGAFLPSVAELWVMAFLTMVFFGGVAHIRPWLAAVAAGTLLLIGAVTQWVSPESLPQFALPWISATFTNGSLADAASGVPGLVLWNAGVQALAAYAVVGVILAVAAAAFGRPRHRDSYDYGYDYDYTYG